AHRPRRRGRPSCEDAAERAGAAGDQERRHGWKSVADGITPGVTEPPAAPPDDTWPVADEPTVVSTRDTVVGAPPPEPVGPPPPDRRIGAGMLLALGALALIAIGLVIAYLLSQRNDKQTTTVVVTTPPAAAAKVSVPRLIGLQEQVA